MIFIITGWCWDGSFVAAMSEWSNHHIVYHIESYYQWYAYSRNKQQSRALSSSTMWQFSTVCGPFRERRSWSRQQRFVLTHTPSLLHHEVNLGTVLRTIFQFVFVTHCRINNTIIMMKHSTFDICYFTDISASYRYWNLIDWQTDAKLDMTCSKFKRNQSKKSRTRCGM